MLENGDRCEGFLAEDGGVGRHILEENGTEQGAGFEGQGSQQRCARGGGGLDPVEDFFAGLGRDHGTNDRFAEGGISGGDFFADVGDEGGAERGEDFAVDEDALDADAGLAGVAVGGGGNFWNRGVPVGVRLDKDRGVATEFEGDFEFSGARLELPADLGATGEAEHFQAGIGEEITDEFVVEGDDIDLVRRGLRLRAAPRPEAAR